MAIIYIYHVYATVWDAQIGEEAVNHGSVDYLVKSTSVETWLYRQLLLNTFF